MTRSRRLFCASAVLLAAMVGIVRPMAVHAREAIQSPAGGEALRIVVLEGEGAVNIIQQKTAVAPVIEVRDRNNQPGGYPVEIVQHESLILVVYEAHAEIRRIYLGAPAKPEDLFPDRNGYSFGRWEGDKLIVETTHLKEAVDQGRYPHSDQAKVVEEYTLAVNDDGTKVLTSKMTMTDPAFYTQTITAEKKWQLQPGVRLLPYECNEPLWDEHLERLRQGQDEPG